LKKEEKSYEVYPPKNEIFNAFNLTPLENVKVVLIGQDPYFKKGEAHGLSFSVKKGVKIPPSLARIYNVLEKQIDGFKKPNHGCLESWAKGGVLLLNAALTVRQGVANSHKDYGWHSFTDAVIKKLSKEKDGIIFFLWGKFAEKKSSLIDHKKHSVLICPHPSPQAGSGFIDKCNHFSEANNILIEKDKDPIDWTL